MVCIQTTGTRREQRTSAPKRLRTTNVKGTKVKMCIRDRFTREENSTVSGIQGTGLGMSITKNIVDLMGGTIAIESEPGKGSEFIEMCIRDRSLCTPPAGGTLYSPGDS